MVDSWVVPATSAIVNTISSIAGSASEAISISRDDADAAERGADVHAGERQREPRGAEQRHDDDEVRRPGEQQIGAVGRHQRGRHPGGGEDDVGRDAIDPRGVVREHHLLVHQLPDVEIGLQQRRPDAAQQPCLDLARDAEQQRRDGDHDHHLHGLSGEIEDQRHAATTSRSTISAQNTSVR